MRPQRHGCRGERRANANIAARRKGPVEGHAYVVDVRPVGSEPLGRGLRLELRLGTLEEVPVVLGVTRCDAVQFGALDELVARVGARRLEQTIAQARTADLRREE